MVAFPFWLPGLSPRRRCARWARPRARRRRGTAPWIEPLESRTLPSLFDIVTSTANVGTFLGDVSARNDISVVQDAGVIRITDASAVISLTDAARQRGCTGQGTNTIACPSAALNLLRLQPRGSQDSALIRSAGLSVPVQVRNASAALALTVDDSANPVPRFVTLTANAISDRGTLALQIDDGSLQSLTFRGGSGGNRFTIQSTGAYPVTVDSGAGQDVVTVGATTGPLTIEGQDGGDTVDVGSLRNIGGKIDIHNDRDRTDLAIAAQDSPGADFVMSAGSVSSSGANITFDPADLRSLTLESGPGPNRYLVRDTPTGAVTTLNVSALDHVQVERTSGLLDVVDTAGSAQVDAAPSARVEHVFERGTLALAGSSAGNLALPTDADRYRLKIDRAGTLRLSSSAPAGSVLDGRLTLSTADSFLNLNGLHIGGGGQLLSSDDARPGEANLELFVRPGPYIVTMSATALAGAYILQSAFEPSSDPFAGPDVDPALNREVGTKPVELVTADFNRDGILDVATVNQGSADVSVLLGVGDTSFERELRFPVGGHPDAMIATDFNVGGRPDGRLDLLVLDRAAATVTVLPGVGDGTFAVESVVRLAATPALVGLFSTTPTTQVEGDFNRDGYADTVSLSRGANGRRDSVRVDIALPQPVPGAIDTRFGSIPLSLLLDASNKLEARSITSSPQDATPLFVDLNGDGIGDILNVSRAGDILFRAGVAGQPGTFEAAELVNGGGAPAARAVTVVGSGAGAELVAIDLFRNTMSLYRRQPDGSWRHAPGPLTGLTPGRIAAGDLDGDGNLDVVVGNNLFGLASLFVYHGDAAGNFTRAIEVDVGTAVSGLALTDVDGDQRLDLVATNPDAGTVSVFRNLGLPAGSVAFADELRLRAGSGVYGAKESQASAIANQVFAARQVTFDPTFFLTCFEQTTGVTVGDFTGDGVPDLVVANRGPGTFSLLAGKQTADGSPLGSFTDPLVFDAGNRRPIALASGDFDRDGDLDVVLLNDADDSVVVFQNDGHGHFTRGAAVAAGSHPIALAVDDVNRDGVLDLVIDNQYGDVLVLLGNGDGSFQPYQRAEQNIALAAADLDGDGKVDFVFANQGLDRVAIQHGGSPPAVFTDRDSGVLSPEAIRLEDVNNDQRPDLLVANGGGNGVLVYLGAQGGGFEPALPFFTGTNPVAISIAQLNDDTLPDLVVTNRGSNDVTILFGKGEGDDWTLAPGPRVESGGIGPMSALVQDVSGDGIPDLLVSNSKSNNAVQINGVGNGFFDDRNPVTFSVGKEPGSLFVGQFDGDGQPDLVTVDSGDVTLISNFATRPVASHFTVAGLAATAALAGPFGPGGSSGLVLADSGNDLVSVLVGGPAGLTVAAQAPLDRPSDLLLADEDVGRVTIFATQEGREGAVSLQFQLHFSEAAAGSAPGALGDPAAPPAAAPPGGASPVFALDAGVATAVTTFVGLLQPGEPAAASTSLTSLDANALRLVAVFSSSQRPLLASPAEARTTPDSDAPEPLFLLFLAALSTGTTTFEIDDAAAPPDQGAAAALDRAEQLLVIGVEEIEQEIRERFRAQRPYQPANDTPADKRSPGANTPAPSGSTESSKTSAPCAPAARLESARPMPAGTVETAAADSPTRWRTWRLALASLVTAAAWQGWGLVHAGVDRLQLQKRRRESRPSR